MVYTAFTSFEAIQIISEQGIYGDFHPGIVVNEHLTNQFFLSMGALGLGIMAMLKKQVLSKAAVIFAVFCWVLVFLPIWLVMYAKYM